jgi:hypothetical protein
MATSATAMEPRSPSLRAITGATAPAPAKHSTGAVVSSATHPPDAANDALA